MAGSGINVHACMHVCIVDDANLYCSQYSKNTFSIIDGSGELKGLRSTSKFDNEESLLFKFVCLDLKQVKGCACLFASTLAA
jgi:hypothetical protein